MTEFQALSGGDTFCFACTQCGECCFDQLVLLEPLDLFWLSRLGGVADERSAPFDKLRAQRGSEGCSQPEQGAQSRSEWKSNVQSSVDLFSLGIVALAEHDGEWRCALQMPRFANGTKCRFLAPKLTEEGRLFGWSCSLHLSNAKPFVCSLSPVARTTEDEFYLVPPTEACPGMNRGKEATLQAYLEAAQLTERLSFSIWFHKEIRPLASESKEQAEAVYNFDREKPLQSPEELKSYLQRWALR